MWKYIVLGSLACASASAQSPDKLTVKQLWEATQRSVDRLPARQRGDTALLYRLATAQAYAGDYDRGWQTASSIKEAFIKDVARSNCWRAGLEMVGQERELPGDVSELTRSRLITDVALLHIQRGDSPAASNAIEKMAAEGVFFVFRTDLYWRLGEDQLKRGNRVAALEALVQAQKQADQIPPGSSFRATKLYVVIAETFAAANDIPTARASVARAAALAERDDKHEGPCSLTSKSWAWVARGQAACQMADQSALSFQRAEELAHAIPEERDGVKAAWFSRDRAGSLNVLAAFESRLGHKEQAAEHFRKAVEHLMLESDEGGKAGYLSDLIDEQARGGNPELALSALDRVRSTNYRIKSQCSIASCVFDRGDAEQAAAIVRAAETELGEPVDEDSVGVRLRIAETWARLQQPDAARRSFRQAAEEAGKLKLPNGGALPIAGSQWRSAYFEDAYETLQRAPAGKDKCLALAELTIAVGEARAVKQTIPILIPRSLADPF
jgi:tetratricopeptide (TPR) repeat protein